MTWILSKGDVLPKNYKQKEKLPRNYVSFMANKIYLGVNVAKYFFNRGFKRVVLEYDYLNKNLIIEGMTNEKIREYEYNIIEALPITTIRTLRKTKEPYYYWEFYIPTTAHRTMLDFDRRNLMYPVKLLAPDRIIVENIHMLDVFQFSFKTLILDSKKSKIILYTPYADDSKTGQSLKKDEKTMTERFIEMLRQRKINNQSINDKNSNLVQNIQTPSQSFQPTVEKKEIVNKEIDNNVWGFNPPHKLPTPQDRAKADKEYNDMILGSK